MSHEQPAEQTAQERLHAAGEKFAALNRSLPQGLAPFQLPETLEAAAATDALARLLLAKGVIGEDEFVEAKTLRMAELTESMTEQASALKREVLARILTAPPAERLPI